MDSGKFEGIKEFEQLSIKYKEGKLKVLDQTRLPDEEIWYDVENVETMWQLIKQLSVRGAPLIGVAAVLSLAVKACKEHCTSSEIIKAAQYLKSSRPTAVNLMVCCDLIIDSVKDINDEKEICKIVSKVSQEILNKEIEMYERMSKNGAALIQQGEGILTHCNTGSLATPGQGTALGVIKEAHKQNKNIHIYVDETRPLLQGGRLTTYELEREGIPYTLICDNMAATLMRDGKIQRVLVGADRIATNGDFANKIGTYSVAILAKFHNIPFHTVAPVSTIDFECSSGMQIPIEMRKSEEVQGASGHFGSVRWAPKNSKTYNPAFDVTPVDLVHSIILDTGVYDQKSIKEGAIKSLSKFLSK